MREIWLVLVGGCAGGLQRPVVVTNATELLWTDIGGQTLRVQNDGEVPLGVADVAVSGIDAAAFTAFADLPPAEGLFGAIGAGDEAVVDVAFVPTHSGAHDALLTVVYADGLATIPVEERPTTDRRRVATRVWLHGDAPGPTAPTDSIAVLGLTYNPTGGAEGEVVTLEVHARARDAEWVTAWSAANGVGELSTPGEPRTTWVAPLAFEPSSVNLSIIVSDSASFQSWEFVQLTAGPLTWFDEPIYP